MSLAACHDVDQTLSSTSDVEKRISRRWDITTQRTRDRDWYANAASTIYGLIDIPNPHLDRRPKGIEMRRRRKRCQRQVHSMRTTTLA